MDLPGRRYHGAGCRTAVLICSDCDRGQRYCTTPCADEARRQSIRASGRRYQDSSRGRHTHAERQRRYRARQQIVTHQGSPPTVAPVPRHCCRCHRPLPDWVRQDFLRRRVRPYPPDRRRHGSQPRN